VEFRTEHKGVAVSYYPGCNRVAVVYASGLPQYPSGYHPFVRTLCDLGYHLFVPKYPGSWETSGVFGVANSVMAVQAAVELARTGRCIETYNNERVTWTVSKIIVVGFSYGALPALMSVADAHVVICPFTNVLLHQKGDLEQTLAFIRRAYKHVYRIDNEAFLKELDEVILPETVRPLTVVIGAKDSVVSPEEVSWLLHRYPDARIKVSEVAHTPNLAEIDWREVLEENI